MDKFLSRASVSDALAVMGRGLVKNPRCPPSLRPVSLGRLARPREGVGKHQWPAAGIASGASLALMATYTDRPHFEPLGIKGSGTHGSN